MFCSVAGLLSIRLDLALGRNMQYPREYGFRMIDTYSLSVYGWQFLKAVTPKN